MTFELWDVEVGTLLLAGTDAVEMRGLVALLVAQHNGTNGLALSIDGDLALDGDGLVAWLQTPPTEGTR